MVDNWHRSLISSLAYSMRPACFIELGLGATPVLPSVAEHCVVTYGVDVQPAKFDIPENCKVFHMSTDEFFSEIAKTLAPPELVFVDADHRSQQVLKDLANIHAICADNCIVVCHDTYPDNQGYTSDCHCSDSYRVPSLIDWEHVTIPRHPGCTIIRMKPVGRV